MHLWQIRQFPNDLQNPYNRYIFCITLILFLVGSRPLPAQGQSDEGPSAQEFFKKVLAANSQRKSVQATLVEQVSITDQPIRMKGQYLERGEKSRLELDVRLSKDSKGSLLEISDGDFLWNQTVIGETKQISLRNLKQIATALSQDTSLAVAPGPLELGLGGLSGLLSSLERSMDFDQLREDSDREGKVVVLQGKWKPEFVKQWQPKDDQELPSYIPEMVRISFDPETMFPRRFLYLKRHPEKKTYRPLVRLEFHDVKLEAPIDEALFQFTLPEGEVPDDVTQQYIDQLKSRREMEAAKAAGGGALPGESTIGSPANGKTPAESTKKKAAIGP